MGRGRRWAGVALVLVVAAGCDCGGQAPGDDAGRARDAARTGDGAIDAAGLDAAGQDRVGTDLQGSDTIGADSTAADTTAADLAAPDVTGVDLATCQDSDGDGRGLDCPAGTDCDDDDPHLWNACGTCADTDGDGRGAGCDLGTDCAEGDPDLWASCATCVDADSDGRGQGCDLGLYCDDGDPNEFDVCDDCVDNDNDSHFIGCDAYTTVLGPDCKDDQIREWQFLPGYLDNDDDGYTVEPPGEPELVCSGATLRPSHVATSLGQDCNDDDPTATTSCPARLLRDINPSHDRTPPSNPEKLTPSPFLNIPYTYFVA